MKAVYAHAATALALTFGLAACVSAPPPAPTPPPVVRPAPAPTPTPPPVVQEPRYDNWMDAPQTRGNWIYAEQSEGGMALFSAPDSSPLLMLECDREGPGIKLFRSSNGQGRRAASIRTETATRTLQLDAAGQGHITWLNARDPILDAMALSKGRFAVEVEGERTLYLPAWVEVSRVIEDCR